MAITAPINPGPSWLLHKRLIKDNVAICTMFSASNGKYTVLVNGANSKKRKLILAPFQELWLEYQVVGNFNQLKSLETVNKNFGLYNIASLCGLYLNELLYKSLPDLDANPALLELYLLSLSGLAGDKKPAYILRNFEYDLLKILGYELDFTVVVNSIKQDFLYYPEQGFVGVEVKQQQSFSKSVLLDIKAKNWSNMGVNPAARRLFSMVFSRLLPGGGVKSKELLMELV